MNPISQTPGQPSHAVIYPYGTGTPGIGTKVVLKNVDTLAGRALSADLHVAVPTQLRGLQTTMLRLRFNVGADFEANVASVRAAIIGTGAPVSLSAYYSEGARLENFAFELQAKVPGMNDAPRD